jgi:hypothetical protein
MSERERALAGLEHCVSTGQWKLCPDWLFRSVYGIREDVQLPIAAFMMRRYLPIFLQRWPTAIWAHSIIEAPRDWVRDHGRAVPDDPEVDHLADSTFMFCFDALLLGYKYTNDSFTTACCTSSAVLHAVEASALNAWVGADPEAAAMADELHPVRNDAAYQRLLAEYAQRNPGVSKPAVVARGEAWRDLHARVRESSLERYPDANRDDVEKALERWNDANRLIIVPEAAGMLDVTGH